MNVAIERDNHIGGGGPELKQYLPWKLTNLLYGQQEFSWLYVPSFQRLSDLYLIGEDNGNAFLPRIFRPGKFSW